MAATSLTAFASPHMRRGPTAPRGMRSHAVRSTTHAATVHLSMAPERATEIQSALIKAGYMTGSPTGQWDATSQMAMEKLQSDNGWQTKLVPDSRAIIKLGLGPGSGAAAAAPGREVAAPVNAQSGDTFAPHMAND